MSEQMIERMDFKQLRRQVQQLADELAVMNRRYEDLLYNLDWDNFSSHVVKEKDGMKTQISINAGKIETKVSSEEFLTRITQTDQEIQTVAEDVKGLSSTVTQTAKDITSEVKNREDKDEELFSLIQQTAEEITSQVSVSFTGAQEISYDPNNPPEGASALDTEKYYFYNGLYYYWSDLNKKWVSTDENHIYSVFRQTEEGFELTGDVVIDGSIVKVKNITFDASSTPVKVQYSITEAFGEGDSVSEVYNPSIHQFMRLSVDGGKTYGSAIKITAKDGEDGAPGQDGSDADVTAQKVFDVLTEGGTTQGLFTAFYDGGTKLFINAEYIRSGTLSSVTIDVDTDAKIGRRLQLYDSENEVLGASISIYDESMLSIVTQGSRKIYLSAGGHALEITPGGRLYFDGDDVMNQSAVAVFG